jgi:hypothetical protein
MGSTELAVGRATGGFSGNEYPLICINLRGVEGEHYPKWL